jgi:hypothetical protein
MNAALGQVIFERTLSLAGGGQVFVQAGAPRKPEGEAGNARDDCYCVYQITGIGDGKARKVWGVDSVQAVQLTLRTIGAVLYASAEARAGKLTWAAGSVPGDLGFPVPPRLADLLPPGTSEV